MLFVADHRASRSSSATDAQRQTVQAQIRTRPAQAVAAATPLPQTDERGFVDKAKNWAEDHQIIERLNGDIDGWYPRLGGMTRGSGFAFGPGYRMHVGRRPRRSLGRHLDQDVQGGRRQGAMAAGVRRAPRALDELSLRGFPAGGLLRARADVAQDQPHQLRLRQQRDRRARPLQAGALAPPRNGARLHDAGHRRRAPTATIRRSSSSSPTSRRRSARAAELPAHHVLCRRRLSRSAGHPRSGGFYHVAMGIWNDRTLEHYDFKRFDANFSQFVPLDTEQEARLLGRVGLELREQRDREAACRSTSFPTSAASTRSAPSTSSDSGTRTRSG